MIEWMIYFITAIYLIGFLITFYMIIKEPDSMFAPKQQFKIAIIIGLIWPYMAWCFYKRK